MTIQFSADNSPGEDAPQKGEKMPQNALLSAIRK